MEKCGQKWPAFVFSIEKQFCIHPLLCAVHPEEKMGLVGWGGHCTGQEHLQRLLFKVSCHQLGHSISQSAYAILSLSLHTHERKNAKASLYDHKQIKVFPLIKPIKGHKCWGSLFEGVFYMSFLLWSNVSWVTRVLGCWGAGHLKRLHVLSMNMSGHWVVPRQ